MIDLSNATLIGSGHERVCYRHPHHPDRVIKVTRPGATGRDQNRIDHYYLASLEHRGVPAIHLPRQYGMVETSLGDGLVLDCITNADGGIAQPVLTLLRTGALGMDTVHAMLAELYDHLLAHSVVMVDIGLGNLVGRTHGNTWQAVVIDGLGARHFDIRLRLRTHLLFLARRKLRAQWRKWDEHLAQMAHD